ncbi:MAG: type III secretion system chaperone [Puniceicoccales bacterium]|nr:type III secretion system chaperone [Puniceicoccales bacterium]
MDLRNEVNRILARLAKSLHLNELSLDNNQHCMLMFDDKIVLNLELDEKHEHLVAYAYLGEVPLVGRENIFEKLLEPNFFWNGTNGMTIGIDKQSQTVVLMMRFQLPLKNPDTFEENLADFVDTTESWMHKLSTMTREAEEISLVSN